MRRILLVLGMMFAGLPLAAQDQTLMDIRRDLNILYSQIEGLRAELTTSTSQATDAGANGPALLRLDSIEGELRQLTGAVEQLQFEVQKVVRDGTNRIADLEFRLVAAEGGDLSQLPETTTLGGGVVVSTNPSPELPNDSRISATAPEEEDFSSAMAALDAGKFGEAAEKLALFTQNYPGGPYSGQAHYWRGEALASQESWKEAARAFLESFSGAPKGVKAPNALYRLGVSLGNLGQVEEACLTLSEVPVRFPDAVILNDVQAERAALSCS